MAIGSRWMATYFNRPGLLMFDYDVYSLGGDGCMMEGISQEAASLAAHLKLSKLQTKFRIHSGKAITAVREQIGKGGSSYAAR